MSGHAARAKVDIAAPAQQVWAVLTEPSHIAEWMGGSHVETDWRVGSPITWKGEHGGRKYEDKGVVLEVEKHRRLSMTHYSPLMGEEDVPENYHTVTYTMENAGAGTRLELTQDGCSDEQQAAQFSGNWQQMLDGLKKISER